MFQFQAVDATTLGWSSASVTVLFQRLLDLHAEHGHQLQVDSYHPLRVLFTYDDDQDTVDPYGGILRLNPASTPLQMLAQLQLVTPHVLQDIRQRRENVTQMQKALQAAWGVKWKKGFSCSSRDFYYFLVRLTESLPDTPSHDGSEALIVSDQLVVTVESPLICRRPVTTRDGAIRLGAAMLESQVRLAIDKLRPVAAQKMAETHAERQLCRDLAQQATWALGLSRLDYRSAGLLLDPTHVRESLTRLVREAGRFKNGLAGHAVGIVGSGHFCHLGDDGTVQIPYDWQ